MTDAMRTWPSEDTAAEDTAPEDTGAAGADTRASHPFGDVELDEEGMPTSDELKRALKAVMDPEIGINIVDLGLVYDIVASDGHVQVDMTLTSMGCPLTELIHQQCTLVLTRLPNVESVDVNFVFSPPWSTDMISDEARDELRAMGFNV